MRFINWFASYIKRFMNRFASNLLLGIGTCEVHFLILVQVIVTFIQGHRSARKQIFCTSYQTKALGFGEKLVLWACAVFSLDESVLPQPKPAYLSVFVQKSASKQYGYMHFSKYKELPESRELAAWMNWTGLPTKSIVEHYGVYIHQHLHISSHFLGWSIWPILIGQNGLLNRWIWPSSVAVGFSFKLSVHLQLQ